MTDKRNRLSLTRAGGSWYVPHPWAADAGDVRRTVHRTGTFRRTNLEL